MFVCSCVLLLSIDLYVSHLLICKMIMCVFEYVNLLLFSPSLYENIILSISLLLLPSRRVAPSVRPPRAQLLHQ